MLWYARSTDRQAGDFTNLNINQKYPAKLILRALPNFLIEVRGNRCLAEEQKFWSLVCRFMGREW
jgi:hypothetical protein